MSVERNGKNCIEWKTLGAVLNESKKLFVFKRGEFAVGGEEKPFV